MQFCFFTIFIPFLGIPMAMMMISIETWKEIHLIVINRLTVQQEDNNIGEKGA